MRRSSAVALVLLGAACGANGEKRQGVADAVNEVGVSLALCGVVERWVPPEPPRDGELVLERVTWPVAAGARLRGTELLVPHEAVCITAGIDGAGRIVDCEVTPRAPDPWGDAGR
jgi:hypothetical protein